MCRIPIDAVDVPAERQRLHTRPEDLVCLASSILETDLIHPITVKELPGGRFELLAGTLRLAACRLAGEDSIVATVVSSESDADAAMLSYVENEQRVDLNPLDEARAVQQMVRIHGKAATARRRRRSKRTVEYSVAWNSLPDMIRAGMAAAGLAGRHATALLRLGPWPEIQSAAFDVVRGRMATCRATECAVARLVPALRVSKGSLSDALEALDAARIEELFDGAAKAPTTELLTGRAQTLARDLRLARERNERFGAEHGALVRALRELQSLLPAVL